MPPKKPAASRAKTSGGDVFRITYDGKTYDLPAESDAIPARVRMDLANQSGFTLDGIKRLMGKGQSDDFMIVAFVFVVRKSRGDSVTFDELLDAFDPEKLTGLEVVDPSKDGDSPEA